MRGWTPNGVAVLSQGGQERVFGVDVFGVVRSENTNESGEHDSSQAEPLRARSSQGRRL